MIVKAYGAYRSDSFSAESEGKYKLVVKTKVLSSMSLGYNKITVESPLVDENGNPILKRGKPQADTTKRDTENVPLDEDVDVYFAREVKHRGVQFTVCYFAPESTLNDLAVANYQKNVCQCIRQWHYSETTTNTVDMMLAVNGIPVVAIELKNQLTGQSIDDAKRQWMYARDPKEPCVWLE